ncbi:MAG: mandelate racemase/muconate lactonizing enzyme family protein [Planctomycetes bacterium]|nr:mandelate racemase/muconate lactonizing enzyme family protein [Planctomycetota bacterium]
MRIQRAERLALNVPFYCERVRRAMQRASTHQERVYVYRIETDKGIVGYGDSLYAHDVDNLVGRNPFAIFQDDRIGFGPQLAVLDAVGKATGVPAHALLGTKLRDRCPVSWWDIDMCPSDWAAEAEESLRRGYTSFKMKARPWRDIFAQVEAVGKVVPRDYKFDIDFNGFLLTASQAEGVLHELDAHVNVGMYESPFYLQNDLTGARILRERIRKPVVEHFREDCLHARCCDGFVVGAGAAGTRHVATLAASFNVPFWLQLVGTGITTAYAVHIGCTLSHARLPYITCHELWEHDLLRQSLKVVNGMIEVPDLPGLGIEVDEKAIEKYRVDPKEPTPTQRYRQEKRILRIHWPAGKKGRRVWEFTDESVYQQTFYRGNIPGFERGVDLEVIEDDGTANFRKHHAQVVERESRAQ